MKNKFTCVSGKRPFESEELAEEALIQNHIYNDYPPGQGPINVYQCQDCGWWHFTSKGAVSQLLTDPAILEKIRKERRANYWERHLK